MGDFSQNIAAGFQAAASVVKTKISSSEKGVPNGVATLDGGGKIPSSQLPSYVDDVVEYATMAQFPATGTAGILYIDISTSKQYRWGGSAYAQITSGAVDSVAGKTGIITLDKNDVGLNNVSNLAPADLPLSTASTSALNNKVDKVAGKGLSTEDYTTLEKSKLSGIAEGAEVNQNAFTTIAVSGQNNVVADSKTDTLTLVAGSNITITTNDVGDSITITGTSNGTTNVSITHGATNVSVNSDTGNDGTINSATTTTAGVMSSADKTKLDGVETGAQVNTVTSVNNKTGAVSLTKADIGLGNVSNLAPLDLPVSTAQQSALDAKATNTALNTLANEIGSRTTDFVLAFNTALNA